VEFLSAFINLESIFLRFQVEFVGWTNTAVEPAKRYCLFVWAFLKRTRRWQAYSSLFYRARENDLGDFN
jgi:hypothetical protein